MSNISFTYLYRDAANYKKWGEVIFANPNGLDESIADSRLRKSMEGEENFIANKIGVKEVFLYDAMGEDDDDHWWHEFDSLSQTDKIPTDKRTLETFVKDVEKANASGWLRENLY